MTLREQIETLPEPHAWGECVKVADVLAIIDQHEQEARESIEEDLALQSISPPRSHVCIPDRDALARALVYFDFYDQDAGHLTMRPTQENIDELKPEADRLIRIIAALRERE